MSARGFWVSHKFHSFLKLLTKYRYKTSNLSQGDCPHLAVPKLGHDYPVHQGLQLISPKSPSWRKSHTNMSVKVEAVRPSAPVPSRLNFSLWVKWILGSILSLLLPLWKQKWDELRRIEGEVETVVEEIENVAEVVEKVATVTEKVSAEVADKLPEKGKVKEAAMVVEHISKATARDAKLTIDFIHKVDELKEDVDDIESFVEPFVHKIIEKSSQGK